MHTHRAIERLAPTPNTGDAEILARWLVTEPPGAQGALQHEVHVFRINARKSLGDGRESLSHGWTLASVLIAEPEFVTRGDLEDPDMRRRIRGRLPYEFMLSVPAQTDADALERVERALREAPGLDQGAAGWWGGQLGGATSQGAVE